MRFRLIAETDNFFEKLIFSANEKQVTMHDSKFITQIDGKPGIYLEELLKEASKLKIEILDDEGCRVV